MDSGKPNSSNGIRGDSRPAAEVETVKRVGAEMGVLIEELQAARRELDLAAVSDGFDAQRPALRVLKVEVLNHLKTTAESIRQLRWLITQMLANESEAELTQTLSRLRDCGGASLVEQVEAIVTAALGDKPLLQP